MEKVGVCWACVEYNDDWTPKKLVAYCMAGNMCEEHKDDDGIEQITDPQLIRSIQQYISPEINN